MIASFIFIFGAVVGSFLNVCIHRMPKEESIVFPSSHCPACKKTIQWKDNIPLLSYVWLKRRCRHCHVKISVRYFLTELLTGLCWLGLYLFFGFGAKFIAGIFLISILIAITFTDFETQLIPDKLSLPGILAGLLLSGFFPALHGQAIWYWALLHSFIGLLVGGGILLLTAYLADIVFKKESMGGGDIKLLAMIGTFVGFKGAIFSFFFAPFIGLPFGLYMRFAKKSEYSAYGPFLAMAGMIYYLFEKEITGYLFYF